MASGWLDRQWDRLRLVRLSARMIAGRRYGLVPLLVLTWPAFQYFRLVVNWRPQAFEPVEAQGLLIGVPLTVLAIGLGVRIIAGELDQRTLEIAYTVPGGAQRAWVAKLFAATGILIVAEAGLALVTVLFLVSFPAGALYGAFQAAIVYLVLSMALAALFKSEATGAMGTVVLLLLNAGFTGFGSLQLRVSPFWNPLAYSQQRNVIPADVISGTIQNRIGMVLVILAIVALSFSRAERREKMLSG